MANSFQSFIFVVAMCLLGCIGCASTQRAKPAIQSFPQTTGVQTTMYAPQYGNLQVNPYSANYVNTHAANYPRLNNSQARQYVQAQPYVQQYPPQSQVIPQTQVPYGYQPTAQPTYPQSAVFQQQPPQFTNFLNTPQPQTC